MRETLSIQRYVDRKNPMVQTTRREGSIENPQRLHARHPKKGDDIVRSVWRHTEVGRNDLPPNRYIRDNRMTGYQRAGKESRVQVAGTILAHASYEANVSAPDLPTVNFTSYNAAVGQTFDEGIFGAITADLRTGGDWDANASGTLGQGQFSAGVAANPPGIYPRDDLNSVYFYPNVVDNSNWIFPYMRVRSAVNGSDVNGKVSFNFAGKNQGNFYFPGNVSPTVNPVY